MQIVDTNFVAVILIVVKHYLFFFGPSWFPDEDICLCWGIVEAELVNDSNNEKEQTGNHQLEIVIIKLNMDPSDVA